jgi:VIT1/CCC1 family predicted Fe2+/Mn2+ transporter
VRPSGCSPAVRRCARGLRQLAIGFGAAAVTYVLGLLFNVSVG